MSRSLAKKPPKIYVALGSNLSLKLADIRRVPEEFVADLQKDDPQARLLMVSAFYQTPAFPDESDPDFINAVFQIETKQSPIELLRALHDFETAMGRERPYRWAPRVLDLDLLFYGDKILPSLADWRSWADLRVEEAQTQTPLELILPHPRAHERGFVLRPLIDLAPEFVHPVLNKTMRTLYEALPERQLDGLQRV